MKGILATHGVMDTLNSDNGPQFASSQFKEFTSQYGFNQGTSKSPFPPSKWQAECAVKVAQKILSQKDPHLAILHHHCINHSALGVRPAEALMGRHLQTRLPRLSKSLMP